MFDRLLLRRPAAILCTKFGVAVGAGFRLDHWRPTAKLGRSRLD